MHEWKKLIGQQKYAFVENSILKFLYLNHQHNEASTCIEDLKFATVSTLTTQIQSAACEKFTGVPGKSTLQNNYVSPALFGLEREEFIFSTDATRKKYILTDKGIDYIKENNILPDEGLLATAHAPAQKVAPTPAITEALGHAKMYAATPEEIARRNQEVLDRFS